MECSCSVGTAYFDCEDSRWGEQKRTAAKEHKCFECGADINKADTFWYHTVFSESGISNYKVCEVCESLIKRFFLDGWTFGGVRPDLEDYLHYNWKDDLPSSCIAKLTPKAREYVCDILQIYQEE